jgi:hypothetical protein
MPAVVGEDEVALTLDPHEARLATSMRRIHAKGGALTVGPMPGRDEEGVGPLDPASQLRGEAVVGALHGRRPGRLAPPPAFVDVLGTVPERLFDGDLEACDAGSRDPAVDAVAPPRGELDPEEADVDAAGERVLEGVADRRPGVDRQGPLVRRAYEAWLPGQQRRPGSAALVAGGHHDEGEARVEPAVLVGQMSADDLAGPGLDRLADPGLDRLADPEPLLDLLFACVERRRLAGHGLTPSGQRTSRRPSSSFR